MAFYLQLMTLEQVQDYSGISMMAGGVLSSPVMDASICPPVMLDLQQIVRTPAVSVRQCFLYVASLASLASAQGPVSRR